MDDIDDIVNIYETYEDTNQRLYDEVNQLSNEEDDITKEIQKVKEEISQIEAQNLGIDLITTIGESDNLKVKERKRKQILKLQKELETVEKEETILNTQATKITKIMSQLKKGVPLIFDRIGCNVPKYMETILGNEVVNDGNILLHMKIIERRTNEIIQMYDFVTDRVIKRRF